MDLETTGNRWTACELRAVILQNSWLVYSQSTWVSNMANWSDVCLCMSRTNHDVVSHVDDPLICAKPATLEKIWMQIARLVVIKRGEALNHRVLVVYLGFEYEVVAEDSQ